MLHRFDSGSWTGRRVRLAVVFFALAAAVLAHAAAEAPLPWGDQGDGTYRNPILPADYSDPDVIRVADDFYLVASEFHFMGIQVLHSRDLVNWQIVSRVFDRLDLDPKYNEVRAYSQGTWAPSLRHHDGIFYLYVCTPRDGLLRWTATNPAGPWTVIVVKSVDQWEDPCPFWDDDGNAYLVHGKLGAGPLMLHRMSADGATLLDEGREIYRGPVAEGPKLFKRNGWYYISLPEGGVERGGQTILRSREIFGPYERRVVLADGAPHQGGLVELTNGEAWFIGFKSAGAIGRVPMLQPVKWVNDWPVFGDNGQAVLSWKKPTLPVAEIAHPQTSDEFTTPTLAPQWQWNHNPTGDAYSLTERAGWLRLRGKPTPKLETAPNTLTQKIWGGGGSFTVKLDPAGLAEGQRAGAAFMSGKMFDAIGVKRESGALRIFWSGAASAGGDQLATGKLEGSITDAMWLRGDYTGISARLSYSLDGEKFTDSGLTITLAFSQWKGARLALFCYGADGGSADFDFFRFEHGQQALPVVIPTALPIDREALVRRHNPVVRHADPSAPLTVGNGQFAFTVDITGLQTFGAYYHDHGIPLETMARWCWATDDNPNGYKLADTYRTYTQADGTTIDLPTRQDTPAGDWLRRNPHQQPLGQLSLEWDRPDGTPLQVSDVEEPEQTLDLWTGVITSRYKLGGVPVTVTTAVDPDSDTVSARVESPLVTAGKLRLRLAFPRGYDPAVKNTPALDWSAPESHQSRLSGATEIDRSVPGARYHVSTSLPATTSGQHAFQFAAPANSTALELAVRFSPVPMKTVSSATVIEHSSAHWSQFWRSGAAVDFTGSTNLLAAKFEERIVFSRYLTAVQCVGDVPPQESGLTCSTWYGKHHTEMIWWHAAHFALWGHPEMAARNVDWFLGQLPAARALAESRGLKGARWAKMVGIDGRESPGGNPLIVWNQPHLIYLCDLLLRNSPSQENLEKYRPLVFETAECLASMLKFDAQRQQYVLGPPLWIAQEIHDPATSQNPSFELAYWRWALETAQRWRVRSGLPREAAWDHIVAHLPPLPQKDGKYVALESVPDTWDNLGSRHDHPQMLMPLGFLPATAAVDRATMDRTLTAVLQQWDWDTKIWGWDYPMVAMTATRLGRPADAVEILLRDGPNNRYTPNGHCPQGSDNARKSQSAGKPEIAVYLPANGAFLSAAALMIAGWEGCAEEFPGIPKDGTWTVRAESLQRLP